MQATIAGTTMPVLKFILEPGEAVVTPHGELSWMSPSVRMSQTTSTGPGGGFMRGLKRVVGGGGLFLTRYESQAPHSVLAFAAQVPGHIMPVDVTVERPVFVHRHGWLAGTPGVGASMAFQKRLGGAIFGGEGFILQKLEGQGRAWVELSGELTELTLNTGEQILAHPGHVGMFESTVSFTTTAIPGIKNKLFGGDGWVFVALTGPGRVWLQSMPLPGLAHALTPYLPAAENREENRGSGGGSAFGGLVGDLFRGND
jgi:uncharacterized protein (TIGR00266 family)